MENQKHIKLQAKHYSKKIVPELKMSGVWLEQLGFRAGDSVMITAREELLIIQPNPKS